MMKNIYLIQRLLKPFPKAKSGQEEFLQKFQNSLSFGGGLVNGGISKEGMEIIKEIFRFDYMGSAEFEFGAVPKALAKIWDEIKDYVPGTIKIQKKIFFICHKDNFKEVESIIKKLAKNEHKNFRLKQPCRLEEALNGREETCGWLELDNSFMFFTDESMFKKTVKMFGIK